LAAGGDDQPQVAPVEWDMTFSKIESFIFIGLIFILCFGIL
jgi:hypothetical protein